MDDHGHGGKADHGHGGKADHGHGGKADHAQGQQPDCDDAVHRLYHFLDGELTPDKRVEIQRHLDACLPCLEAFDFEAELRVVIATKCRDQVPDALRERIASAIHHAETNDTPPGGIPRL